MHTLTLVCCLLERMRGSYSKELVVALAPVSIMTMGNLGGLGSKTSRHLSSLMKSMLRLGMLMMTMQGMVTMMMSTPCHMAFKKSPWTVFPEAIALESPHRLRLRLRLLASRQASIRGLQARLLLCRAHQRW